MMKITPPRFRDGPVDGQELQKQFAILYRDVFARLDTRYADNDFKDGVVANTTGGVTLGNQAIPKGRVAGIPAITARITDVGRAQNQQFLWPVTVGNRSSVQSTSSILTSSSDASTSTVTVAAHSVKYDFGSVAYNPGSVSGLTTGADYLVYADDANFVGGAVSYIATTNPDNMIATGRYYVGEIVTAISSTVQNISAATSANPIAFTTGTHGWVTGNQVTFAALPGDFGTNLNGNTYTITVTGGTTFTIAVDGHLYAAYSAGGTATRVTTGTGGGGGAGAGGGAGGGGKRWGNIP